MYSSIETYIIGMYIYIYLEIYLNVLSVKLRLCWQHGECLGHEFRDVEGLGGLMRDLRCFRLDVSWFHIWLSISISRVRNRIYARRPYGDLFHQVDFENMSWIAISTFWKTWAVFRPWEINLWMQPATPIAAEIISRCSSGPTAGRMLL